MVTENLLWQDPARRACVLEILRSFELVPHLSLAHCLAPTVLSVDMYLKEVKVWGECLWHWNIVWSLVISMKDALHSLEKKRNEYNFPQRTVDFHPFLLFCFSHDSQRQSKDNHGNRFTNSRRQIKPSEKRMWIVPGIFQSTDGVEGFGAMRM